ncbi:LysR substrate-binding domain-containing protein, partial [Rhizobium johnstonii]
ANPGGCDITLLFGGVNEGYNTCETVHISTRLKIFCPLCKSKSRERPRGRLRVSVPHIVGHQLLMPILPIFDEQFPEIELDIDFEDKVTDLV